MPTATENRQPAPHSPLKRLVDRHSVAAFRIMLYAIAWSVFLPVVLHQECHLHTTLGSTFVFE